MSIFGIAQNVNYSAWMHYDMQLFNKFMLIKRGSTRELNLERAADILKMNNHNLHTYFWKF